MLFPKWEASLRVGLVSAKSKVQRLEWTCDWLIITNKVASFLPFWDCLHTNCNNSSWVSNICLAWRESLSKFQQYQNHRQIKGIPFKDFNPYISQPTDASPCLKKGALLRSKPKKERRNNTPVHTSALFLSQCHKLGKLPKHVSESLRLLVHPLPRVPVSACRKSTYIFEPEPQQHLCQQLCELKWSAIYTCSQKKCPVDIHMVSIKGLCISEPVWSYSFGAWSPWNKTPEQLNLILS